MMAKATGIYDVNVEENRTTGYYTVTDDNGNVIAKEKIESKRIRVGKDSYLRRHAIENTTDEGGVRQQDRYSYDEFVSKPDMVIVSIDDSVTHSRTDTVTRAKNNAKAFGYSDESGNPFILVKDTGTYVKLGTDGLRHSLNRTKGFIYPVTENIGEILLNSIRLNELVPKDINAKSTYILIGTAQNESGDLYLVRSIVNSYDNELASFDVLYAVNTKKELAANKSPRYANNSLSVTNSTISIAELLDYVNRYYPQLLPEDVLKHYGYDAHPEGDLGNSTLYQSRDADYLSAVERGDMQTAQQMVDEAERAAGYEVTVYYGEVKYRNNTNRNNNTGCLRICAKGQPALCLIYLSAARGAVTPSALR